MTPDINICLFSATAYQTDNDMRCKKIIWKMNSCSALAIVVVDLMNVIIFSFKQLYLRSFILKIQHRISFNQGFG